MTLPFRRRVGALLVAALAVGLSSACTEGEWRPDAPPAAGVQQDEGPVKVRNLMLITGDEDKGLLLGSVFSAEPVEITELAVAAEQQDGTFGSPVQVDVGGEVPVESGLMLGGDDSRIEDIALQPGLLATVYMAFSDGTTVMLEAPVMSADHFDYQQVWDAAWS